ncbi:MAG: polysaccharide biosynthesis protein [Firmicutes bacterium]|nr:polysaccharide biosynthesis protein [Bacillota bacterium]
MADNRRSSGVLVQAGILAMASMIVRVIGLLYRAPLTAIIGDEGNGYYGTAYNIYTIILMVSSYSMPSAISKLMAQKLAVGEYRNANRVFRCALMYGVLVGLVGSGLLFFGARFLVPDVAVCVLQVFAPTVFLFGILGSMRGYFQARGSMVPTSVSQILEQLANAVVSIAAAWLLMQTAVGADPTRRAQLGAMGSALGTGAGVLIALLFMVFCFRRSKEGRKAEILSDATGKEEKYRIFLRDTILVITPFMLSGVIMNLTTSLNQTIYMRMLIDLKGAGETATTTLYGIFSNKAVVISNIPISIATAVSSAIIPGISAAYARRDETGARRQVGNAIRITSIIAIPSAVGLAVLARPITMLMFPQMESLELASSLLSLLAVTVIFYSISTITNAALQSIGRMNLPLVSAGIALVVQTVVLVLLLRFTDLDVRALVLVSILYSVMIFAVNQYYLRRFLGIRQDVRRDYLQPLVCAALMGAAAKAVYYLVSMEAEPMRNLPKGFYFHNLAATAAALLAAVLVYGYTMVRSGTIRRKDLLSMPKGQWLVRLMEKLHWLPETEKRSA